ncbi:MAG TPA: hypothetical protein VFS32_11465 [Candidatus Limnocylindrales bacterium]|nr:hypothetical protein [Candidatus Limnocylindrales bacterium]
MPPSADASTVLRTYLEALRAGDCDAAAVLWTSSGNGDLCRFTHVRGYDIHPDPTTPRATEIEFATTLTTDGTEDGTVRPGDVTWFFVLDRQPDGAWRISGGGGGP